MEEGKLRLRTVSSWLNVGVLAQCTTQLIKFNNIWVSTTLPSSPHHCSEGCSGPVTVINTCVQQCASHGANTRPTCTQPVNSCFLIHLHRQCPPRHLIENISSDFADVVVDWLWFTIISHATVTGSGGDQNRKEIYGAIMVSALYDVTDMTLVLFLLDIVFL